jgi:hypothetical protein
MIKSEYAGCRMNSWRNPRPSYRLNFHNRVKHSSFSKMILFLARVLVLIVVIALIYQLGAAINELLKQLVTKIMYSLFRNLLGVSG